MPKESRKSREREKARAVAADKRAVFLAQVLVALKPTVNDPEGNTISGALDSLGFDSVESVRSGRYFQVRLRADSPKAARKQVDQMCSRLLANPVIEGYTFEIAETK
jgi:phosphoribosylformylglycinamidine synthase